MTKPESEPAPSGVDEIVSELHERGIRKGQEESERIVAQARLEAVDILNQAKAEQTRLVEAAGREADRIRAAAQAETEQMLHAFMQSLPEMFTARASAMLDVLLKDSFGESRPPVTIDRFVASLDANTTTRLRDFFAAADPQSFVEGLVVMAVAFYAGADGCERFTIDSGLRQRLARLLGDPDDARGIAFEFRDDVPGLIVADNGSRRVVVAPESIQQMAQEWAREEFREVYTRSSTDTGDE